MSDVTWIGRRARLLSLLDTTCGPAPAGTMGTVTVGQPDTDRPRGHPARRLQVSCDVTGGWADCDCSAVELLPLAPADNAPPELTPLDVARQQRDDALSELHALRAERDAAAEREAADPVLQAMRVNAAAALAVQAAEAEAASDPLATALDAYQPSGDSQPQDDSQPPDDSRPA